MTSTKFKNGLLITIEKSKIIDYYIIRLYCNNKHVNLIANKIEIELLIDYLKNLYDDAENETWFLDDFNPETLLHCARCLAYSHGFDETKVNLI